VRLVAYKLLCVSALALSACASAPAPSAVPVTQAADPQLSRSSVPNGAWVGELVVPSVDDPGQEERIFMVLYACGKDVRYYLRNTVTGRFESPAPALTVESSHGVHHLRYVDWNRKKADDWVVTQSLDFVEIDARHARAWWSSTISNRDLPADHARRTLHEQGVASFKRFTSDCPREAKERVLDTIHVPFDPDPQ
jgi:hypothetical protein